MKHNKLFSALGVLGTGVCVALSLASCGDDSIKVYTRDTTSGTREGFFEKIGFDSAKKDNTALVEGYVEVTGNGTMISSVKNDENGIGYISLSTLSDSGLKGLVYEGVEPTEANVINGTYSLTRNFNYCKRETPISETRGAIVDAFIAYMGTTEGQSTIKQHGGIVKTASTTSWNTVKSQYSVASTDNSSTTINVGGSTSVEKIVSALLLEFSAKCGNFKYNHNATGSGDAYKRTNGSDKDGANACDLAFASREFKSDSEPMAATLKGQMCIDAIVAVVNKSNKVSKITAEELVKIYNGTTTKWADVK